MDKSQQEKLLLAAIKEILLDEDRAAQNSVQKEVNTIKSEFLEETNFHQKHLDPYFEQKIVYLQKNFPKLFGPFLSTAIKIQIRDSQDEIIEALYPIIGKLIRKYISAEIEMISQKIDYQLQQTFSAEAWWNRFVAFVRGKDYKEGIMDKVVDATIEEIFVIDQDSGLLLGHYSFNNLIDADMIAGMLTGIKSFVEQAFMTGPQELEALEYSGYKIVVNSFHRMYVACVVQGTLTGSMKAKIYDSVLDFCERNKITTQQDITKELVEDVSNKLQHHFAVFQNSETS
jgi:hypothetical protein